MSEILRSGEQGPWPPPHPVLDAPYGPRYEPPAEPEPTGWVRGPLPPPQRSKRWTAVFVAVSLLVVFAGGFLAVRFVSGNAGQPQWNPNVLELATFVEQQTDTTFSRAVRVRFLDDAAFEALVTRPGSGVSQAERDQLQRDTEIGRALGWYSGDTDLLATTNQVDASGILAYYSYADREIVARADNPSATSLDPLLRSTIVHELTHAIQDQRLTDLDTMFAEAPDREGFDARTSVIEGQAVNVADAYVASLSPADLAEYRRLDAALGSEIDTAIDDVPNIATAPGAIPYVYGPILTAAAQRSPIGVEGVLDHPPRAMDQVLDPRGYFDGDLPESLTDPTAPAGTALAPGAAQTVGPVRLYFTLASAMDPAEAWEATSGWGNDRYVAYEDAGRTCVAWHLIGDDDASTQHLHDALQVWSAARVAEASVEVSAPAAGEPLRVTACDPGTAVEQELVSDAATAALFTRARLFAGLQARTGSLERAACATDLLFTEFPPDALDAPTTAVTARVDAVLAEDCA